jgi:hypothetical protein
MAHSDLSSTMAHIDMDSISPPLSIPSELVTAVAVLYVKGQTTFMIQGKMQG